VRLELLLGVVDEVDQACYLQVLELFGTVGGVDVALG